MAHLCFIGLGKFTAYPNPVSGFGGEKTGWKVGGEKHEWKKEKKGGVSRVETPQSDA